MKVSHHNLLFYSFNVICHKKFYNIDLFLFSSFERVNKNGDDWIQTVDI